jgi:hypothetical protein
MNATWNDPAGQALAVVCGSYQSIYAHVDDLWDPDESELTAEEIHVSLMTATGPEDLVFCFRMSTISAGALIRALNAAISRRKGGEPWDRWT